MEASASFLCMLVKLTNTKGESVEINLPETMEQVSLSSALSFSVVERDIKELLDTDPDNQVEYFILITRAVANFFDIDEEALHHILKVAKEIAALLKERLNYDGISLCENNGLGQEVKHFHLHLIPKYNNEEKLSLEEVYNKLK